jgi:hypothetical protein
MQTVLYSIWNEAKKLPKLDKIELMERMVHSLKIEDEMQANVSSWETRSNTTRDYRSGSLHLRR